jgi:hypothetical protein
MQQDARPGGMPHWAALNKLRLKAMPVQSRSHGEPGDSSPNDQNSLNIRHFSLQSLFFCLS